MSQPPIFMPTIQALVQCYQAFEKLSATHIRSLGLTPPQFDVIATLGNTVGMTATELGEKTLISKGTLTGVVDRLIDRGWVVREAHDSDRRCQIVRLTADGEARFTQIFPGHLAHIAEFFAESSASDHAHWQTTLRSLQHQFERGTS